jgi:hypothetical protein
MGSNAWAIIDQYLGFMNSSGSIGLEFAECDRINRR